MRKYIVLILAVGFISTVSASITDYDVGHDYKSELMADPIAFDYVAVLPESFNPVFNAPVSVTEIPVSKGTSVKPSKAVNVYRRARDAL